MTKASQVEIYYSPAAMDVFYTSMEEVYKTHSCTIYENDKATTYIAFNLNNGNEFDLWFDCYNYENSNTV